MHELGHAIGEDHEASGVMQSTLDPGTRYAWEKASDSPSTSTANIDAYFAGFDFSRLFARW